MWMSLPLLFVLLLSVFLICLAPHIHAFDADLEWLEIAPTLYNEGRGRLSLNAQNNGQTLTTAEGVKRLDKRSVLHAVFIHPR
jgi:hypothetical protein